MDVLAAWKKKIYRRGAEPQRQEEAKKQATMNAVGNEPSAHPMKEEAEDEDENEDEDEDEGCRLTPATYYLLHSLQSGGSEVRRS
jgi:hypothetical protein